jgi:hypothetical protein
MVHKGKKAVITFNKQDAIKAARKFAAQVRSMDYWLFNQATIWDLPTFLCQSDKVDF